MANVDVDSGAETDEGNRTLIVKCRSLGNASLKFKTSGSDKAKRVIDAYFAMIPRGRTGSRSLLPNGTVVDESKGWDELLPGVQRVTLFVVPDAIHVKVKCNRGDMPCTFYIYDRTAALVRVLRKYNKQRNRPGTDCTFFFEGKCLDPQTNAHEHVGNAPRMVVTARAPPPV